MRFVEVSQYPILQKPSKISEVKSFYNYGAILEDRTINGRSFDINMTGVLEVVDKGEFLNHDFSRSAFDMFLIQYTNQVLEPFFKPFFWSLDYNFTSPVLFDRARIKDGDFQMVNFFSDLQASLQKQTNQFKYEGCKINHVSILSAHYNQWLDRKENEMSEQKKDAFDEAMNYRKAVDNYMTALYQDIKKKVQLKEYNGNYYIKAMPLDEGVYISWRRRTQNSDIFTGYRFQVFRTEGGFNADRLSESANGVLVVDSTQDEGETIDYVPARNRDYYYTINYKYTQLPSGLGAVLGEEKHHLIAHLFRFTTRLAEKPAEEISDLSRAIKTREALIDKIKVDKHFDLEETKAIIEASLKKNETIDDLQATEIERLKKKYVGKPDKIEDEINRINLLFLRLRASR